MATDEPAGVPSGGLVATSGAAPEGAEPASPPRGARAATLAAVTASVVAAGACLLPWELTEIPALEDSGRVDVGSFSDTGVIACIGAALGLLATAQLLWHSGARPREAEPEDRPEQPGRAGIRALGAAAARAGRPIRLDWAKEVSWLVAGILVAVGAAFFVRGPGHRPGSVGPAGLGVVRLQPWLFVAGGAGALMALAGLTGVALRVAATRGRAAAGSSEHLEPAAAAESDTPLVDASHGPPDEAPGGSADVSASTDRQEDDGRPAGQPMP